MPLGSDMAELSPACQDVMTSPSLTLTGTDGNGLAAGPCTTAPVKASKTEPCSGQTSWVPSGATIPPAWVQTALKATTVPAVGWATETGPSAPWTTTAPPTGTLLSATRSPEADPPLEPLPVLPEPALEQAASEHSEAEPARAPRAPRRVRRRGPGESWAPAVRGGWAVTGASWLVGPDPAGSGGSLSERGRPRPDPAARTFPVDDGRARPGTSAPGAGARSVALGWVCVAQGNVVLVHPVRQWRFRGPAGSVRSGDQVTLTNDQDPGFALPVRLRRKGASPAPLRYGEPVMIDLVDAGTLTPSAPGSPLALVLAASVGGREGPEGGWQIAGGSVGGIVSAGRPLALLAVERGDYLVLAGGPEPETGLAGLDFWCLRSFAEADLRSGGQLPLPVPEPLRGFGHPLLAEVHGVLGQGADGIELVVDEGEHRQLREHLDRWAPAALDVGGLPRELPLVPGTPLGRVLGLPPHGTPLRAAGTVMYDPGSGAVRIDPLDSLAWAEQPSQTSAMLPVSAQDPDWPEEAVTWRVLALPPSTEQLAGDLADPFDPTDPTDPAVSPGSPQPADPVEIGSAAARSVTWFLPLPLRDGEPGSATTFTPLLGQHGTTVVGAPAIVRHPSGGQRVLRLPVSLAATDDPPGPAGCAVRVHRRARTRSSPTLR